MPLSSEEQQELQELEELAELEALEAAEQSQSGAQTAALKNSLPKKPEYSPVEGQSFMENLQQGVGSGMTRALRGTMNLFSNSEDRQVPTRYGGMMEVKKTDPSSFHSDESVIEAKRLDQPLSDTAGGTVGQIVGETASTAPLTAGAGAGLKALGAGARSLPGVLKAGRVLGSAPVRAGVEGAISSAITADPGQRGTAAMQGAGAGVLMDRAGAGLGRLVGGLVKKSQAADDLAQLASQSGEKIDLPLSMAAGDQDITTRLFKSLYREGLPLIPGVQGRLAGQADDAMGKFRTLAIKEATPEGLSISAGDDVGQTLRKIKQGFDSKYQKTVKQFGFIKPPDFRNEVAAKIKKELPAVDSVSMNRAATQADQLMERFSSGKNTIRGENLLDFKNEMSLLIKQAHGKEKQALIIAASRIDDMIKDRLTPHGLHDEYLELAEPYRNFKALSKAANAAKSKGGNFTPAQLARAAPDGSALQVLSGAAQETLGSSGPRSSAAGRALTGAILGGYGYFVDPTTAGLALGGGHALASKGVQKTLMGTTEAQEALSAALRKNPRLVETLGRLGRGAVTTKIGEENGGSN